jgi:hypothetical protein
MKRGKSQYSVEFLVTYGWALLVIGIIVAAIYAFGWFNPNDVLPQRCNFYGQIGCKDFYVDEDVFNLSLINNFGANLFINHVNIEIEESSCSHEFIDADLINWQRNKYAIASVPLCAEAQNIVDSGERIELVAQVYYFYNETCSDCERGIADPDCLRCVHSSTGKVIANVN